MTAVALLHGFAGSAATFERVRDALAGEVECIAPLIFGHGASASGHGASAEVACYEDEVDRLAALVPAGAVLVGYSFGGRLAMGMLARHPARFAGAVLVGAHPGLPAAERAARAADDARWTALLRREGLEAFIAAWEAQPIFASQAELPAEVRDAQRAARRRLDPMQLADAMDRLGLGAMPCWTAALARVTVPIAFLAGARDPKYVALGRALEAEVPALRCTVVPDAGHNVVLECPSAVAAAVRAQMAA